MKEIEKYVQENSCLVTGLPGCGKSELIKRVVNPETDLVFSYTGNATENLKDRDIFCKTFDSYFHEKIPRKDQIDKLEKVQNVYVDEYSQAPAKFYGILIYAKMKFPDLKVKLFGDGNQCTPIESNGKWFDYHESTLVKQLVDCKMVKMLYKPELGRYDEALYDVVTYFKKTRKLPDSCKSKKEKFCWVNVCKTNKKRKELNEMVYAKFLEKNADMKSVKIGTRKFTVGMPVMCCMNLTDIGIFNAQIFKVSKINKEEIVLTRNKKEYRVPFDVVSRVADKKNQIYVIEHGFAFTVYKIQGCTIREDYCIHEIDVTNYHGHLFNHNEFYTAISRGTKLEHVHFKYTDRMFKKAVPPTTSLEIKLQAPKLLEGKIYRITDGETEYIGSTEQTLEKRFEQHKMKPTNKDMKNFLKKKNIKIELIRAVKCIDEEHLLEIEMYEIGLALDRKKKLLNKQLPKRQIEVKVQMMPMTAPKIQQKFDIKDDKGAKALRIRWTETIEQNDEKKRKNKQREKKFPYGGKKYSSKEDAMKDAIKFKATMEKKF
jgi:hypothetical protein